MPVHPTAQCLPRARRRTLNAVPHLSAPATPFVLWRYPIIWRALASPSHVPPIFPAMFTLL
ncbi:MAG TPA: hypothetical protein VF897_01160 [Roseiflexaceae bacterium]